MAVHVLGMQCSRSEQADSHVCSWHSAQLACQNHVLLMLFKGFRITVRFPMPRKGTQLNAPCSICPDMPKPLFYQGFHGVSL